MSGVAAGARVIVALDFADAAEALALVQQLHPAQCRLKVGLELFTVAGPGFVGELAARGFDVFLDLKFHDIPNTVERACRAAAGLGVWMLNVHASGGPKMLEAARCGAESGSRRPILLAVTILTSHGAEDLRAIGWGEGAPAGHVGRLARLTRDAGLDGVVCSAEEAALLRRECGHGFCLVTPGIRPSGAATGDQQRVMTPEGAIRAGADYLVIGRPITQAPVPLAALQAINAEVARATA